MTRALWLLVALAACDNANSSPDQVLDVEAAWQTRCPGCSYPEHAFTGTIDVDNDPQHRFVACSYQGGKLDVSLSQSSVIDPQHPVGHGFGLTVVLGYEPASGFDLERQCQIVVEEEDDRQWGASCSSDTSACQLVPNVNADELWFTLRCSGMSSIPFQAGREADLSRPNDPQAALSVKIEPCQLTL